MFQVKVWMEIMDDTAMIPSLLFFSHSGVAA